ncbi:hypothetical protein GOODEAATRI_031891, partial [Goodea atripinnis]
ILQHYVDLYIHYMKVWRDMCSKVTSKITLVEFTNFMLERSGVTGGEPWSEARAYVSRLSEKVSCLISRAVGQSCEHLLTNIDLCVTIAKVSQSKNMNCSTRPCTTPSPCHSSGRSRDAWHPTSRYSNPSASVGVVKNRRMEVAKAQLRMLGEMGVYNLPGGSDSPMGRAVQLNLDGS